MFSADTIIALSSGHLPSGVAVIRLSGPHVRFAVETIAGNLPAPRVATLRTLRDENGVKIDSGLILFFAGPESFTGEDCAEFQVHGGRAVVSALLERLSKLPDIRLAEAGEFTRRAFLNGKMDLLEAEALADLVNAETEAQRRLATSNVRGEQGKLYARWRTILLQSRALLEAELDFSDEEDVVQSQHAVDRNLFLLAQEIDRHISDYKKAEIILNGLNIVIVGAPNAGKSSLLNSLAKRDVAIVSDQPGTTRDALDIHLDLDGYKVNLTDTAGLRDTDDTVERIGVDRALKRAGEADLVLELVALNTAEKPNFTNEGEKLVVGSKADLQDGAARVDIQIAISTLTGIGLDTLIDRLKSICARRVGTTATVLPSRIRHVGLLRRASASIVNATSTAPLELKAELLRQASDALAEISGAIPVEDVLDVIFSQFCIGK